MLIINKKIIITIIIIIKIKFSLFDSGPEKGLLVKRNQLRTCSKCPPSACTHARSLFRNAKTALSILPCSKLSQIFCSTTFSSSLVVGLGLCFVYFSSINPHTQKSSGLRSGEFGGHSSFLMKSGVCLFLSADVVQQNKASA